MQIALRSTIRTTTTTMTTATTRDESSCDRDIDPTMPPRAARRFMLTASAPILATLGLMMSWSGSPAAAVPITGMNTTMTVISATGVAQPAADTTQTEGSDAAEEEKEDRAEAEPSASPRQELAALASDEWLAVRVPEWDDLFVRAQSQGWNGTGSARIVDMRDARILWLFGPTWIGPIENGVRVPDEGTTIPNSIALHPRPRGLLLDANEERNADVAEAIRNLDNKPWGELEPAMRAAVIRSGITAPPDPDRMDFFAGVDQIANEPAAWIIPDPLPLRQNAPVSGEEDQPFGWYVPFEGVRVPGVNDDRLVLFLEQRGRPFPYQRQSERYQKRQETHRTGPSWALEQPVGASLALIDRPHLTSVGDWQKVQVPNRLAINELQVPFNPDQPLVEWGITNIFESTPPDSPLNPIGGGFVYMFGARRPIDAPAELYLVRAPAGSVDWFHTWRYWNPSATGPRQWSPNVANAAPIMTGDVPEVMSLISLGDGEDKIYAIISNEPDYGDHIMVQFARDLTGPWTAASPVFRPTEMDDDRDYFIRSVEAHTSLSGPNTLLLSYVVDSRDPADRVNIDIFRPRFIGIPLPPIRDKALNKLEATAAATAEGATDERSDESRPNEAEVQPEPVGAAPEGG